MTEPKIFSFTISVDDRYIVVVGDHKAAVGEDKRRKKEGFIALHRNLPTMDHVQTMTFGSIEKNFIVVSRDEESGIIFACEYGPDIVAVRYFPFIRITDDKLYLVQQIKGVHIDYPFHVLLKSNRLYTCSLTQGMSAVEFTS